MIFGAATLRHSGAKAIREREDSFCCGLAAALAALGREP
jgi:hypothetical protein